MGAFIYRTEVSSRIVELENETEKRKEFLGAVACIAACALGVAGLLARIGLF